MTREQMKIHIANLKDEVKAWQEAHEKRGKRIDELEKENDRLLAEKDFSVR
jgi:hypothetical protein